MPAPSSPSPSLAATIRATVKGVDVAWVAVTACHCEILGHTIHVCCKFVATGKSVEQAYIATKAEAGKEVAFVVTHCSASNAAACFTSLDYDSDELIYFLSTTPALVDNKQVPSCPSPSLLTLPPQSTPPLPIFNTSCSSHITGNQSLLHNFSATAPTVIWCANGEAIMCVGCGTLRGIIHVDGSLVKIAITNVKYVPDIRHTLLSPPH